MSLYSNSLAKAYMLHVRSKDVEQLSTDLNTNMRVNLDAPIRRDNALQDIHLSLSTAHIPFTFYQFSSNLENLNIYVDGSSSFVLTAGNYDIFELIDLITASSFPYNATYNENTNKITLTNSDATSHTINFSGSESKGLAKNLGFSATDITVSGGGTAVSDGSVNLQTIHTLYIHSDLALSNVITTETKNYTNIIDQINVDVQPFEIISHGYYESAPFASVLFQEQIKSFELSLRDQNSRLVDMNNSNFELSILFEIHNPEISQPINENPPPQLTRRRSMIENIEPVKTEENSEDNIPNMRKTSDVEPQPTDFVRKRPDTPLPKLRFGKEIKTQDNVATAGTFSGFPTPQVNVPVVKQVDETDNDNPELLDALLMANSLLLDNE